MARVPTQAATVIAVANPTGWPSIYRTPASVPALVIAMIAGGMNLVIDTACTLFVKRLSLLVQALVTAW